MTDIHPAIVTGEVAGLRQALADERAKNERLTRHLVATERERDTWHDRTVRLYNRNRDLYDFGQVAVKALRDIVRVAHAHPETNPAIQVTAVGIVEKATTTVFRRATDRGDR